MDEEESYEAWTAACQEVYRNNMHYGHEQTVKAGTHLFATRVAERALERAASMVEGGALLPMSREDLKRLGNNIRASGKT